MNNTGKIATVAVLAVLIGVVVFLKQNRGTSESSPTTSQPTTQSVAMSRLIELGSTSCVPCKMMEPILEELRIEYSGQLDVQFIDVNKYGSQAQKYKIRVIPTQVFFNAKGEEIFRHEGFFPKAKIVEKFKEHGILLEKGKENEENK